MRSQLDQTRCRQRKTDSVGMSAIAGKNIAARFECVEQVECRDGTSGTMAFVTIARNDQRGPAITLDDPRGRDSNHAAVPAVSVNDDAESIVKSRFLSETGIDRIQDSALFLLTLSVELIEPVGD